MSNMPSRPAGAPGAGIQLKGGAAILAPISSFPNGVPGNALVLLPINANGTPLEKKVVEGPVALQMEEVPSRSGWRICWAGSRSTGTTPRRT
jgi:hypothetical protein